ncbi:hypothetical protein GCM10022251_26280 [Phytohabitans flavus]|uniref:Uncharacterized protein n=1 Tax=Phytohabitans flavus TaxID=1076124 RepID=A0A6F8XPT6_9ACTN|nr:hypothetical protein [Phytohabitans flavus]BCB75778.1 hypothetical protein Pflav_021880 [Phytohabitans flavus]
MPAVHVPAGDAFRTPSGVVLPTDIDPFHRRLHRIAPAGLVDQTSQTSGMKRREAISGNPDPDTEAVVVIARTTQEAIVVNLDGLDWSEVTRDLAS